VLINFDWDEHNTSHIARHDVKPKEVEEALSDPDRCAGSAYNQGSEPRWAVLGSTLDGRVLFVVFTFREGQVRVVTARDAHRKERERYRS
jgi:hypothetical protein